MFWRELPEFSKPIQILMALKRENKHSEQINVRNFTGFFYFFNGII